MPMTRFLTLMPVLSLLLAGTLWGLFWYPLRLLDDVGLGGLWTTLIGYGAALICALPWAWRHWKEIQRNLAVAVLLGFASGWCNMAFILAMIDGTVVRVLLLFYLSPLWAVILAYFLLGERPSRTSLTVLLVAMCGAVMMLWSPKFGFPWPESRSDWLALSSGFAFALSNVLVRKAQDLSIGSKMTAAWWGAVVLAAGWLAFIDADIPQVTTGAWMGAIAFGLFGLVVVTLAVQYGVSNMPVHRSAVILLFELVVGAVSALILTDEVVRTVEWIGGACILLAAWISAREGQHKS